MDPETEKHFAALIMEEAARLRLQADREGVHAYLANPIARGKPNPQFLKATVRGIEQANRAAEVSGMWKRRAMELELEERESKRGRYSNRNGVNSRCLDRSSHSYHSKPKKGSDRSRGDSHQTSSSPRLSKKDAADCASEDSYGAVSYYRDDNNVQNYEGDLRDEGLKEEEVESFLHSRVKRGRGMVGSRMDETGPYPSAHSVPEDVSKTRLKEEWEQRIIGPSREVDKRQLVDSKKHRKKRQKVYEGEDDCSEGTSDRKKKKWEKKNKKKHRSLHKKSKKKVE